jgi:hypothetical protein
MRCLSCQQETSQTQLKILNHLLLCGSCHALAEKAQLEIDRELERAKQMTQNWLEQHILRGGLLRGGSGVEGQDVGAGSQVRDVLLEAEVPGVRGAEGRELSGHGHPSGDGSEAPGRG